MAKHFQISIPNPCGENWNEMKPIGCGRFCDSCQKQVVDFTKMDDHQLALFFSKNTGGVCGRVSQDQLSRDFTVPRKQPSFFWHLLKAIIPAILLSNKGYTQGEIRRSLPDTAQLPPSPDKKKVIIGDTVIHRVISGRVVDTEGKGLVGVSVVSHENGIGTITKKDGDFELHTLLSEQDLQLEVSFIGYTSKMLVLPASETRKDTLIILEAVKIEEQLMGFIAFNIVLPEKIAEPEYVLADTSLFNVFPNPVVSGTSINIGLGETISENFYEFSLVSFSGKTVFENKIWIDKGARVLNLNLPSFAPGSYFAVLRNRKLKKQYAQQILIIK